MSRLMIAFLFLFGLVVATSAAQEFKKEDVKIKEPYPSKEKAPGKFKGGATDAIPGDVEIHFLNGSKVRMLVQSEKLEIATPLWQAGCAGEGHSLHRVRPPLSRRHGSQDRRRRQGPGQ